MDVYNPQPTSLGQVYSTRYESLPPLSSPVVKQALNHSRKWLVTPVIFMPLLHCYYINAHTLLGRPFLEPLRFTVRCDYGWLFSTSYIVPSGCTKARQLGGTPTSVQAWFLHILWSKYVFSNRVLPITFENESNMISFHYLIDFIIMTRFIIMLYFFLERQAMVVNSHTYLWMPVTTVWINLKHLSLDLHFKYCLNILIKNYDIRKNPHLVHWLCHFWNRH